MKGLTIVIPTYKDEFRIGECLRAIFAQDYPREQLQVLVVDDNPQDRTVEIARQMGAEVVICPHRSEDLKKPFAINQFARGEIIGLLDSDNVIPPEPGWLRRMVAAFSDPEIWGADTLYYTFRPEDTRITKYLALLGGDDPIASYLGVNDRYCYFTGKWTGAAHREIDRGDYLEVELDPNQIPAMGSNGFFFRKALFNDVPNDPFVHQVFAQDMVGRGHTKIAKVKQGLIHVQTNSFRGFLRKKIRRMERRRSGELKAGHSYGMTRSDMIKTGLYVATIVLPVIDAIAGYRRKPTSAWWLHPVASVCLLFIYAWYTVRGIGPVAKTP